ncbi:hypothetical protein Tco_1337684 [Tanacetum coccineum]
MFQDFRYSDNERLSRSDEVLKLKNFKKDATLKLSKSTNQEWYEHVGPEVTKSQDGETRLYLVDDLTVLNITSPLTRVRLPCSVWFFGSEGYAYPVLCGIFGSEGYAYLVLCGSLDRRGEHSEAKDDNLRG